MEPLTRPGWSAMVVNGFQGKIISNQRHACQKGVNQANSAVTTTVGEGRAFPVNISENIFEELEEVQDGDKEGVGC